MSIGSGCGLMQAVFCYRPCVDRGDCVSGPCDATCGDDCGECGPSWGPSRGPAPAPRRSYANDCGVTRDRPVRSWNCYQEPCMDPCGECCQDRCWHRGPVSCIFALFARETWCGPTCGKRYWGSFYDDPPDCWDPCDCHGNYGVGCRSSECRQARRVNRYSEGCFDYGYGTPSGVGREQIISETERVVSPSQTPTPAPKPQTIGKQSKRFV